MIKKFSEFNRMIPHMIRGKLIEFQIILFNVIFFYRSLNIKLSQKMIFIFIYLNFLKYFY